jgi:NAD(P)H-binding
MAKFVLFGSTNRTALHFIRHASASNFKVLCLYPYDNQNYDRHSLLISSLGGIPIRYNFFTNEVGHHDLEGLKSILEGARGVVWAAEPHSRETRLGDYDKRFMDYYADLRMTLSLMREMALKGRFLLLTRHPNEGEFTDKVEKWWRTQAMRNLRLVREGEQLESMMNTDGLNWTILRVGHYLSGIPPIREEERGRIEVGAKPSDGVWRDDVARTMVELLKVDGLSSMFLNIKSVPWAQDNAIPDVIKRLAMERNRRVAESSKVEGIPVSERLLIQKYIQSRLPRCKDSLQLESTPVILKIRYLRPQIQSSQLSIRKISPTSFLNLLSDVLG